MQARSTRRQRSWATAGEEVKTDENFAAMSHPLLVFPFSREAAGFGERMKLKRWREESGLRRHEDPKQEREEEVSNGGISMSMEEVVKSFPTTKGGGQRRRPRTMKGLEGGDEARGVRVLERLGMSRKDKRKGKSGIGAPFLYLWCMARVTNSQLMERFDEVNRRIDGHDETLKSIQSSLVELTSAVKALVTTLDKEVKESGPDVSLIINREESYEKLHSDSEQEFIKSVLSKPLIELRKLHLTALVSEYDIQFNSLCSQANRYEGWRKHTNAGVETENKAFGTENFKPMPDLCEKADYDSNHVHPIPQKEKPFLPCPPDICIAKFYTKSGKLGLHQDKDESRESLDRGLPVVSFSKGDTAAFLYGNERDIEKAELVKLESGDVLIFGGESRHIFHGVSSIVPDSAPRMLLEATNMFPGRLNLTFRQY
ncbi:hypothetical protein L2E82_28112 [Cichorium intybus]|uniref:Uncharacterized protein n=1 Tax=Cichorium intybus TaxID=13427 RepID=A0ACB9CUX1_CICIN|nr:hypothetical protein L2E82_28112 [Cichorium intybus]